MTSPARSASRRRESPTEKHDGDRSLAQISTPAACFGTATLSGRPDARSRAAESRPEFVDRNDPDQSSRVVDHRQAAGRVLKRQFPCLDRRRSWVDGRSGRPFAIRRSVMVRRALESLSPHVATGHRRARAPVGGGPPWLSLIAQLLIPVGRAALGRQIEQIPQGLDRADVTRVLIAVG